MRPTRALALLTALVVAAALIFGAGTARAAPTLSVGMGIAIGDGMCSLGFFAYNADHDRLAVTAGHCATDSGQQVSTLGGAPIGTVVSWLDDADPDRDGRYNNTDPRGYSLIQIDDRWTIEPFFADAADPEVGQQVWKFGERTGQTGGTVTDIVNADEAPRYQLIEARMVVLGGDSGSPWYYGDSAGRPVLAGMSSSSDFDDLTASSGQAQAQTIEGLHALIAGQDNDWTRGFKIWVDR